MTATILPFDRLVTCRSCQHFDTWSSGVGYCWMFDQDIETPEGISAEDCPGFEAIR